MRTFPGFLFVVIKPSREVGGGTDIPAVYFPFKKSEKKETWLFLLLTTITTQRGSVVIVPYMFFLVHSVDYSLVF